MGMFVDTTIATSAAPAQYIAPSETPPLVNAEGAPAPIVENKSGMSIDVPGFQWLSSHGDSIIHTLGLVVAVSWIAAYFLKGR